MDINQRLENLKRFRAPFVEVNLPADVNPAGELVMEKFKLAFDFNAIVAVKNQSGKSLLDRSRYVWECYIGWGTAYPRKRKALRQLAVSDRITQQSKKIGGEVFGEIQDMMRELAIAGGMKNPPQGFAPAIMTALADTTMDFIALEPTQAKHYTKAGFDAFWKAFSK